MKRQSEKADRKAAEPEGKRPAPRSAFVPGDPRINRTIPGPGRPTNRFKNWCKKQVMQASTRKQVRKILKDNTHPAFKAMWSELAAHAHGRPGNSLEVKGKLTLEQLVSQANAKEKE